MIYDAILDGARSLALLRRQHLGVRFRNDQKPYVLLTEAKELSPMLALIAHEGADVPEGSMRINSVETGFATNRRHRTSSIDARSGSRACSLPPWRSRPVGDAAFLPPVGCDLARDRA